MNTLIFIAGRFDLHVQVPGLSVSARIEILRQTIVNLHLLCSAEIICNIASKCDGYDAYDLVILFFHNDAFHVMIFL